MPVSRRVAALTVVIALVAAAPAGAQSAGDDQYEDPFAGEQEQGQSQEPSGGGDESSGAGDESSGGGSSGGEDSSGGGSPEPVAPAATDTGAPAPAPAPAPAAAQLPYTGADAGLLGLGGVLLLAGGIAIRVRLREQG